ncbi:hypothetical protein [Microbacterium sp. 179-I 3D3 NHS]|uniref:hypothetical protein n=1 Tax=unclassified Microbacterium TaxID=2609290 RepID=UPI0039A24A3C
MARLRERLIDTVASLLGGALAGVFAAIRAMRHPRPIHPRGLVLIGDIAWLGTGVRSGIAWIDAPPVAPAPVTARLSRSVGLPAPLPDVIGLALRITIARESRFADLELATTGIGVPGRFLLRPHRTPSRALFGTLLPYRSSTGPVLIAAQPRPGRTLPSGLPQISDAIGEEPWTLQLSFARPRGPWHPFAEVTLRVAEDQDDHDLRFDALRHPLPGASAYRWERLARQLSYDLIQRTGSPGR